jgi:sucrose-6-phosphate hydrolase SacC (GH32 family)
MFFRCRFYQYLPDACEWDFGIIWGHAYSEDLVHWEHLPPALVPSPGWVDADGCFSGCCVQQRDSGKPMILYTGVRLRSNHDAGALPPSDQDLGMVWIESQCAAIPSENDDNDDLLIHWDKLEIPFLNLPPKGYDLTGWRDPFIVSLAGCGENDNGNSKDLQYTMLIGSGIKGKGGTALVYGSDRLEKDWKLLGLLCEGIAEDTGVVWECPVLLPLPRLPPEYRGAMQSAPLWLHCGRQSKDNKSVADKLSSADLVMKGFVGGTQDSQVRRITGFPKSMPEPPRSLSGFDTGSESDSMKSSSLKSSSFSNKKNPSLSLLAQKLEEVSVSDTTDDNNGAEKESSTEAPSIASRVNSSKPNELDNDYDRFEALKSRVKPLNLHGKVEKEESEDSFRFTNTQEDAVAGDAWYFFTVSPDAPTNPVLYWTGHMQSNGANTCPKFDIDHAKGPYRLDLGDILYAPNVCQDAQGRWLLWGWLQERRKVGSYAYSGCLTVPRVLHVTDEGRLIQAPAREIEKLREKKRAFHAQRVRLHHDTVFPIQQVKSERLDIECSIERGTAVAAGILFRSHEAEAEGSTAIIYDWERNHLEAIFNVPTNWKPVDIAETPKFSGSRRVSEDSGVSCDPAVMLCRSFSHTDSFAVRPFHFFRDA